jgi:flagellar hook-associated protein 3 FlgL
MALRPVESMWYRSFLSNLTNTKTRYDEAISQTTSGKKLNYLSDNPSDMSYVLTLRSKIGQIDQFEKNINSAYGYLNTSESALDQVQTLLYSVVSLAEQGASEDNGADERATLADRIDSIRDEILNFANTEIMGKFVFAGSATDTVPFDRAVDTWDAVNQIWIPGVVTYNGNSDDIDVQADFSVTVTTNIPGDQVFTGPIDVFDDLSNLIVALRNNDTTGIANEISTMNELINQMSENISTIGNRTAHLQQIEGLLKNFRTSIQEKMSSLEDADMAEAVSNLAREEVALQATLQSGSRIQRYSLMDYLG